MYLKRIAFLTGLITLITSFYASANESQQSWAWSGFERLRETPILVPDTTVRFFCPMRNDSIKWMESDVFNPAAIVKGDSIVVLFRAEDNSNPKLGRRTSRIGYASSADGVNFTYRNNPVLFPGNDSQAEREHPGGCEDPRIIKSDDGTHVMLYTQWNHKTARLGVATSTDLINWTKHGPAFTKAYDGRFANQFTKSASILTQLNGDEQIAMKINGKYWMYWGEYFVNVATSDDLINWTPIVDEKGELIKFMEPRKGKFDSVMTECGPPAIYTDQGIILFYNGKNASNENADPNYTRNTYCGGQALFDPKDPTKLLDRLDTPFFVPETDFEKSGQYPAGTVFIEGLVFFKGKWLLYYGCADSAIGVAAYYPHLK